MNCKMENKNNIHVKIHADIIEDGALEQIELIKDSPAFRGLVAIMPDVHQGMGCVIGFTGHFTDKIIPNIIGVDIGCGVVAYNLGKQELDFAEVDKRIRESVPLGFSSRQKRSKFITDKDKELISDMEKFFEENSLKKKYIDLQLGTLGGGNHFLEIAKSDKTGELYLLIHSGSRNYGHSVASHYQKVAADLCKSFGVDTPQHMEYLPMNVGGDRYIHYMKLAQQYATMNRRLMVQHITERLSLPFDESKIIESVHNFIAKDNIVRRALLNISGEPSLHLWTEYFGPDNLIDNEFDLIL